MSNAAAGVTSQQEPGTARRTSRLPRVPARRGVSLVGSSLLCLLLASCGGAKAVYVGEGKASSSTPASPTATAPAKASSATVQKALAALTAASATLQGDFAWVSGALPPGGRIDTDPAKMRLFPSQRAAAAAGKAAARSALGSARAAAKVKPRDCVGVHNGRSAAAAAAQSAQAALTELKSKASAALASMQPAATDRARVQTALASLRRLAPTDPKITVQADVAQTLAFSYTASEQSALTAAVEQAVAAATDDVNAALATAAAVQSVAPTCG